MDHVSHPLRQTYDALSGGRRPTSVQLDELVEELTSTDLGAGAELSRKQLRRRISEDVEALLKRYADGDRGDARNDARERAQSLIGVLPPLPGAEHDERDRESTRPASDDIRKMVDDIPRGSF